MHDDAVAMRQDETGRMQLSLIQSQIFFGGRGPQ